MLEVALNVVEDKSIVSFLCIVIVDWGCIDGVLSELDSLVALVVLRFDLADVVVTNDMSLFGKKVVPLFSEDGVNIFAEDEIETKVDKCLLVIAVD